MFSWLRNIFKKPEPEKDNSNILFGHDLDCWRYLGRTRISFTHDGEENTFTYAFFFVDKEDMKKRSYYVMNKEAFENHAWIYSTAELWRVCELDIYQCIGDRPSEWMKQYMLEKHGVVWSQHTNWWTNTDDSNYEKAKLDQSKKKDVVEINENVVKVDFDKKEKH